MDHVHRFSRPGLRSPRAILAFEGWNDACEAASGAAGYVTELGDGEPFAVIDSDAVKLQHIRDVEITMEGYLPRRLEATVDVFTASNLKLTLPRV